MFFQESSTSNHDLPEGTNVVASHLPHGETNITVNRRRNNAPEACKEEERDFEISSSATIKWSCSIALHLLQLSLNINEKRTSLT